MKSFSLVFVLLFSCFLNAQVGIGNTSPNGALDITSTDNGLLIPRIALTSTTVVLPVITGTESELVYNTATTGDVTPGFYYLITATGPWVRLAGTAGWLTEGNTGVTAANFIGSINNADVAFKRNNVAAGRISATSTSFGVGALSNASPSNENTAVGFEALKNNTNLANTAFGYQASAANGGALRNVAIGHSALALNTANDNTALGFQALAALNDSGATFNVALGFQAMQNSATGSRNTFVGRQAGLRTSGSSNVGIGTSAFGSNILNTGSNNIVIGDSAGSNLTGGSNNILIGQNAQATTATTSNQIVIGTGTASAVNAFVNAPGWSYSSDRRLKSDIKDSKLGLDFIKTIRPVSYYRISDKDQKTEFGFIAQELETALITAGITNTGILSKTVDEMFAVRYNEFLPMTVKAVQEQQVLIEELQKQNEELVKINATIIKRLEALENKNKQEEQ